MHIMSPASFFVSLCLLAAAQVAAADESPRYRGHAQLTNSAAAADQRYRVHARLLPGDLGPANQYQLSARLYADTQLKATAAACAEGLYANGFE